MKKVFHDESQEYDNLTTDTFTRNTNFLKFLQFEVLQRIFMAFGVDIKNGPSSVIPMESYVSIICFLKYRSFRGNQLVDIWMRIIAPQGQKILSIVEFKNFIESLVKGHLIGNGEKFRIIIEHYLKSVMLQLTDCGVIREPDLLGAAASK